MFMKFVTQLYSISRGCTSKVIHYLPLPDKVQRSKVH